MFKILSMCFHGMSIMFDWPSQAGIVKVLSKGKFWTVGEHKNHDKSNKGQGTVLYSEVDRNYPNF